MGSDFSVFSGTSRISGNVSMFGNGFYGSALSLRLFSRIGSALSVAVMPGQLTASVSLLDSFSMGSQLSCRSLVTGCTRLSIFGGQNCGSCLSLFD
jgi:hypothetical protein